MSSAVAQSAVAAVCGLYPVDERAETRWARRKNRGFRNRRSEPRAARPESPPSFIHTMHHFLTLEFTQNGAKQAAVFEIGKAVPLTLLPVLEAKTWKKVEYQSKKK